MHITKSVASSAHTAASSSSSPHVCRSTYIAQLRRAFLLRAHPDQFRTYNDPTIQKRQSALLSALANRFSDKDFHDYASNIHSSSASKPAVGIQKPMSYYLESRNGLLRLSLDLNDSVFGILKSMSTALESTGAASLPPPPPPMSSDIHRIITTSDTFQTQQHGWHWAQSPSSTTTNRTDRAGGIDNRYDVNTNRGRDFHKFLSLIKHTEIEERRAARMDVTAAALIARRLYSFQSIDGTRLGWSSQSFVVLLHSLIRLHEEHSPRFHVKSFYPIQLVFSPDDDAFHFFHKNRKPGTSTNVGTASSMSSSVVRIKSLDVFGGNLYLNPAATHLEWLEALQEVTDDNLSLFVKNRELMKDRTAFLQDEVGIKVKKGHSCSSWDYHTFLGRIVKPVMAYHNRKLYQDGEDHVDGDDCVKSIETNETSAKKINASLTVSSLGLSSSSSSEFAVSPVLVVVESPIACRRPTVTSDGSIRISSDVTSISDLIDIISRLSEPSQRQWSIDQDNQRLCKDAIDQVKWELGVQRVYRVGTLVQHDQLLDCLSRILYQRDVLREKLSGQSLGIAGSGQWCHISDDGSIVVPHDWK